MMGWPATFFVSLLCLVSVGASASADVDLMLALDRSLSMAGNDPDRYSLKGVEVFSALLKPADRLGLMTFAEAAEVRVPSRKMEGAGARRDIDAFLKSVTMDGVRTDFASALRLGYETYAQRPETVGSDRILVLFTDGQLNLGSDEATRVARQAIFEEILPRFRAAGIRIFGVAFSSEADLDFLDRLAEATDGLAFRTERPEDLYDAFVQLFEQTDAPLMTPIVGDHILVDSKVQGLELLVKRGQGDDPLRLVDPSNRELKAGDRRSGVDWQIFEEFDHIRIQDPEVGTWKLATSSTDKKAYIDSDLDVDADIPLRVQVGQRLSVNARLTLRNQDADLALLEGARLEARILDASGWQQPVVPFESVSVVGNVHQFSGILRFVTLGNVRVELMAQGRGFQRSKSYQVRVTADASKHLAPIQGVGAASGQEPVPSAEPQMSAAMTLLLANGLILILLVLILGAWWWKRRSSDRDESDLDL